MIFAFPMRGPVDFACTTLGEGFTPEPGTILHDFNVPCPACFKALRGHPCVLVAVGIAPEDQRNSGYTNVSCIAIHSMCLSNVAYQEGVNRGSV